MAGRERTVNLYLEPNPTQGVQHKSLLLPSPGFQPWATVHDLGGRGSLTVTTHTWAAMGGGVYELFAGQTATRLFSVQPDSAPAQLAYNGPTGGHLAVSSGTNLYNYVVSSGALSTVLTGEATQVAMIDEYFLALNSATGKLRLSNLNDGTTWDPTQFALRSVQPDPWQALAVNGPDIILLGSYTGDVWYDAGTSPFPLAARAGLTLSYGTGAPFSLKVLGDSVIWLGQNKEGAGMLVRMQGYNPQPISSPQFASAIGNYLRTSTISDAEAITLQVEGHDWYVLRFPTANATWCYDQTTGALFELGKWNSKENRFAAWAPRMHVFAFGQHLTADNSSSTISLMDVNVGTEADGTAIRRLRRGPILINENKRIPLGQFEVLVDAGLGTSTGQGFNPQIMGRFSSDGGETWSNERQAAIGKIGQYTRRAIFPRLGSPRLWVPEVTFTDPSPLRITDAFLNNAAQAAA